MTIENLEKELKENKLNSMYLLYGEEVFILETVVKKIKTLFGDTLKGINYINLDETNVNNIISDMETPAFGYEKKLIIVKNANIFKKSKKGEPTAFSDKLAQYINENINLIKETVILVIIESEIEKNSLYETIEKNGIVCNFEALKPDKIIGRLKAIANAYKVNVTESTLQFLIEICGTNMQDLINELRKLIEYVGKDGIIEKSTIELLSTKQIDSVIFDLTDCLGKKNIEEALEVLHNLIYTKEPIQKILVTIYNHFKKLYIVKLAEKYNKDIAESINLKPNQMFLTTKYKRQAQLFNEKELKNIVKELINLDGNYKIGLIDINIGLEAILCNYCSK